MSENCDLLVKRAIMKAKNEGASISEIKMSLSYWLHKIDRLDTKEGGNDGQ